MNSLFALLGLEAWKPALTALLLPPVPLLLLVLIGAWLLPRRRRLGAGLIAAALALLWLAACNGVAETLTARLLEPPPALGSARLLALRDAPATAIVVLGGGMEPSAPEYDGAASLRPYSLERLRYGVWLARRTHLPLAFSGGVGWAQAGATAEAQVAARIAADEYGRPLTWVEDRSHDTRENAARTLALLRPAGVRRIVLVTHAWHMPRALRAFRAAAGPSIAVEPAPIGLAERVEVPLLRWLPSSEGTAEVRNAIRELLGRFAGA